VLVEGLDHPDGVAWDRQAAANLGRWHLTLLDPGLRGAPPHRPRHWAADVSG
jgi:hypothetical protein